ncbi:hypothetical protein B0H14DRAFT_2600971 [Mycena olivaceomarginata]|nr:hypothetical protein B0H14DRAFT_2600971 [Mycena olivaceomarginata]
MRREAAKALAKRYDAGERSDEAHLRLTEPRRPRKAEVFILQLDTRPLSANRIGAVPTGLVAGLNEIFPPSSAEFTVKGTPIDPSRQSEWANSWGPQPRILARFESFSTESDVRVTRSVRYFAQQHSTEEASSG